MVLFSDLNLIEPLQQVLAEQGYDRPTPVQAAAIPASLDHRDVLGCAQTGTGKTAAFALPILNQFGLKQQKSVAKRPLALVVAPTRELALQIHDSFQTYGRHLKVSQTVIYGGVKQGRQVEAITSGTHILIATPGRLLDLLGQEQVFLNRLQYFVVDEADRMLDMGFLPDLKKIIRTLPIRRQSMFFSATMPRPAVQLAESMLHDPVSIDVAPEATNVELIDQRIILAEFAQKKPLLLQLLNAGDVGQAIVFTKTRRGAKSIAEFLRKNDIAAQSIHGNLTQNQRTQVLTAFRNDKVQILVATDLAARGLDVEGLTHVFNYELPRDAENYVHRIGRTGRAGSQGIAISFIAKEELPKLREIEILIGFQILPDGREPDPLPENPLEDQSTEARPSRNRRHRQRRSKNRKNSAHDQDRIESTDQDTSRRPTAAERKAARNRRRRENED